MKQQLLGKKNFDKEIQGKNPRSLREINKATFFPRSRVNRNYSRQISL